MIVWLAKIKFVFQILKKTKTSKFWGQKVAPFGFLKIMDFGHLLSALGSNWLSNCMGSSADPAARTLLACAKTLKYGLGIMDTRTVQ